MHKSGCVWHGSQTNLEGFFPKLGVLYGGPHNKDYNILGSPYSGKLLFTLARVDGVRLSGLAAMQQEPD